MCISYLCCYRCRLLLTAISWFWVRTKENTSFHTIWNGRTYAFRFVTFYYCELTSPCLRTHNTLTSSSITWIFISWYIFITVSFIVFNFLFSFIVFCFLFWSIFIFVLYLTFYFHLLYFVYCFYLFIFGKIYISR